MFSPEKEQLERLRLWFPGVMFWLGGHTGRWWAMLPDRLVDAESAQELARLLTAWGVRAAVPSGPVSGAARTRPQPVVRPQDLGRGGR